ncbi:DUF2637 domain-containing protein [Mycobacterium intracellulare]|uniref:DUF2637 domain-containing protein n=1 Tax=Mycobacterium intracellulare TaxID=1767 RepID=UPI0006CA87B9|nr:DUF2637 domain-containing protein [Mycobacterium intracellulare]KPN46199.1 hypothetical protein AN933_26590 [Mycobacterium intracellulare subsp. chimaera]
MADLAAVDDATTRGAVRFFWVWLILATSVSVAGNVAHAVLSAPSATVRLAAAAAVVPPAVLLGSTHSVAWLVRARRVGFNYWCALAMTVALAGCAFVLSFDALRDLAVALGMLPGRAWLWPVAIDVSIANSTLSLLSLSPPRPAPDPHSNEGEAARLRPASRRDHVAAASDTPAVAEDSGGLKLRRRALATPAGAGRTGAPVQPDAALAGSAAVASQRTLSAVPDVIEQQTGTAAHQKWRPTADELVRSGVTSKDPEVVAAVLADHAAGTPTSAISRRHNVHHSTVGRIVNASASRTG